MPSWLRKTFGIDAALPTVYRCLGKAGARLFASAQNSRSHPLAPCFDQPVQQRAQPRPVPERQRQINLSKLAHPLHTHRPDINLLHRVAGTF